MCCEVRQHYVCQDLHSSHGTGKAWFLALPNRVMHALQEGSHDNAKSAVTSFQSMVSNQLAKMEKDFQSGKAFPDLPIIRDPKLFKAIFPLRLSFLGSQVTLGSCIWQTQSGVQGCPSLAAAVPLSHIRH